MKSVIILPVWLFLTTAIAWAELEFESTKQQLKATAADEQIAVEFAFKNTGTTPVTITEVDGNCGCIKAEADKDVYAKGESGTINAVFTIGSKEGLVTNKLWVNYDIEPTKSTTKTVERGPDGELIGATPTSKTAFLSIEMDIPSVITIEPKNTTWTLGAKPEPREVKVMVNHDDPINIHEVKSSRDNVTVTTKEVTPGREYILTLTPKSTDKVQLGMITIVTDSKMTKHQKKMAFFTVSRVVPSSDPSEIVPPFNPPGS